jgi:hypothetical protein
VPSKRALLRLGLAFRYLPYNKSAVDASCGPVCTYLAGNDNNGSGTPANIVTSTGVELATPGQSATTPPAMVGTFSVAQYNDPATGKPYPANNLGKDNNFRGLTILDSTLYVTKGTGGNGMNTRIRWATLVRRRGPPPPRTLQLRCCPDFRPCLPRTPT